MLAETGILMLDAAKLAGYEMPSSEQADFSDKPPPRL